MVEDPALMIPPLWLGFPSTVLWPFSWLCHPCLPVLASVFGRAIYSAQTQPGGPRRFAWRRWEMAFENPGKGCTCLIRPFDKGKVITREHITFHVSQRRFLWLNQTYGF